MSSSRIEQIIEEIEEYVEGCRYQPLSTTKIVVNKEELEELLRELRLKTPDEIKRYQKIIGNRDAIIADANSKADGIIKDAQARAEELVSQEPITLAAEKRADEINAAAEQQANDTISQANQQAQEILDSAQQDANSIRQSAISYTDQLLENISNILGGALDAGKQLGDTVAANIQQFTGDLNEYYSLVNQNRSELAPSVNQAAPARPSQPEEEPEENYEDEDAYDEDDE
ncbi:MAG: ATPase [Eubacterium sp.]|nr:ATPase [Eubacterium sp.]